MIIYHYSPLSKVGDDYQIPPGSSRLLFDANSLESCLEIVIIEDDIQEGEEEFTVVLRDRMVSGVETVRPRRATVIVTGE